MQALANALDQQRLHHAYLFTGTRGVGKTTIARIFSKALNCEQGISSQPCGVCSTCQSIDEGRFVDLIEVDAASRTKVEDTREILDNVQYAPTQGRYKVYLIDEVHMLSKSSFNALLKTLEEPPEHVKFLLATTDPHKLPITVLSRCLQFNLMRLTPEQIQQHLAFILQQEQIPYEEEALAMIAKSADGSARDSLSLLDQAIAYGGGTVQADAVQAMLGLVGQQTLKSVIEALIERSVTSIKEVMTALAQQGTNYDALLETLIESFYEISRYQLVGEFATPSLYEVLLKQAAEQWSPAEVQMLYQMALMARQELTFTPDARIGFEMALLRMVAFEIGNAATPNASGVESREALSKQPKSRSLNPVESGDLMQDRDPEAVLASMQSASALLKKKRNAPQPKVEATSQMAEVQPTEKPTVSEGLPYLAELEARLSMATINESPATPSEGSSEDIIPNASKVEQSVQPQYAGKPEPEQTPASFKESLTSAASERGEQPKSDLRDVSEGVVEGITEKAQDGFEQTHPSVPSENAIQNVSWDALIDEMGLDGMARELANHCVILESSGLASAGVRLVLGLDPQQTAARTPLAEQRLQEALSRYWAVAVELEIRVQPLTEQTPAQLKVQQVEQQHQQAVNALVNDPFVQAFQQTFGAKLIEQSIRPKMT